MSAQLALRFCVVCQDLYEPIDELDWWCSEDCHYESRAERLLEAIGLPLAIKLSPPLQLSACAKCGTWFLTNPRRPRRGCSDRCQAKACRPLQQDTTHQARARRRGVAYESIVPKDIFDRDRWRCALCGGRVNPKLKWPDPMSASLDHVLPFEAGGAHLRANVQCAHLGCNNRKRAGGSGQLSLIG